MHSDRNNHTVDYFWHRHGKPSTGVKVRMPHKEGNIMEVAKRAHGGQDSRGNGYSGNQEPNKQMHCDGNNHTVDYFCHLHGKLAGLRSAH